MALATYRCDRCGRAIEAHDRAVEVIHRCPVTGRDREMKRDEEGET